STTLNPKVEGSNPSRPICRSKSGSGCAGAMTTSNGFSVYSGPQWAAPAMSVAAAEARRNSFNAAQSGHGQVDLSLAGAVEFAEEDPLEVAQGELAVFERDRDGGGRQRGTHVSPRVSVA